MPDHEHDGPLDRFEAELTALFAQYREVLPDPEPSANFTPRLWQQIEARRSTTRQVKRLAQGFVTAAAAVSLLIGVFLSLPQKPISSFYSATYLEILAADQGSDDPADVEIVRTEHVVHGPSQ
jgi:anti-sigma-K factor RskA